MAVQREIVDKDGNRLAVVQGGAGKAAVYGKTAAGEWVPLQVDAYGRAVLNVGEVSATIGVVEQGAAGSTPWPVTLNGSPATFPTLAASLPVTVPAGASVWILNATDVSLYRRVVAAVYLSATVLCRLNIRELAATVGGLIFDNVTVQESKYKDIQSIQPRLRYVDVGLTNADTVAVDIIQAQVVFWPLA